MKILPAIDIRGGNCVRLYQGKRERETIFSRDPVEMAKEWERQGALELHVVDLDGAFNGEPGNKDLIVKIRKSISIPIQLGGGIRDYGIAKEYLTKGIDRVILGTMALRDRDGVARLAADFKGRIMVGIDCRRESIAIEGWVKESPISPLALAKEMRELGVEWFIVTDISKDGTLEGPNLELLKKFLALDVSLIASGGVSSQEDLLLLRDLNVAGAIIGQALYTGDLTLKMIQENVDKEKKGAKRIIPCLDFKDGQVVKGVHFKDLRRAGDPLELALEYERQGAHELVFLDISATSQKRPILMDVLQSIAKEISIPLIAGGGINSLEMIEEVFTLGAQKVSINTKGVVEPSFIEEAVKAFGGDRIIVAIDVKKTPSSWEVMIRGGEVETGIDVLTWAQELREMGVLEVLLTSIHADGKKEGYDNQLNREVKRASSLSVIASGGAGSPEHLYMALTEGQADAVLLASILHFKEHTIPAIWKYLEERGVELKQ